MEDKFENLLPYSFRTKEITTLTTEELLRLTFRNKTEDINLEDIEDNTFFLGTFLDIIKNILPQFNAINKEDFNFVCELVHKKEYELELNNEIVNDEIFFFCFIFNYIECIKFWKTFKNKNTTPKQKDRIIKQLHKYFNFTAPYIYSPTYNRAQLVIPPTEAYSYHRTKNAFYVLYGIPPTEADITHETEAYTDSIFEEINKWLNFKPKQKNKITTEENIKIIKELLELAEIEITNNKQKRLVEVIKKAKKDILNKEHTTEQIEWLNQTIKQLKAEYI